jgi:hypothetical protein
MSQDVKMSREAMIVDLVNIEILFSLNLGGKVTLQRRAARIERVLIEEALFRLKLT